MGDGEYVERHVVLADSVVDVWVKKEEIGCELVDLFISDVGIGRTIASNMVMVAVDERLPVA